MRHSRPLSEGGNATRRRMPALAPLIWTVGYSGLHVTVLLRGVLAWQQPERLVSLDFWFVNIALVAVCAALMTAGWGVKIRRPDEFSRRRRRRMPPRA